MAGKLKIELLNGFLPTLGDSFDFLTATGTLSGTFDELLLPQLSSGLSWRLTPAAHALSLDVVTSALDGDFNHDHIVDAADYTVWRNGLGTAYTMEDYTLWKTHFGENDGAGATRSLGSVPEPGLLAPGVLAFAGFSPVFGRRMRPQR